MINRPHFDIEHRAYVTNSIFSAVAFLEAAVNELFQDVTDHHASYVANLDDSSKEIMSQFWLVTEERNRSAFGVLDKYQIALTLLRRQQFSQGDAPYQNASLLIKLRNELVHYKPRSLSERSDDKLTQQLAYKFPDNLLMSGSENPWFPDKCLGHGCAEWSVCSAHDFAEQFFARIGIQPNYQRVTFSL